MQILWRKKMVYYDSNKDNNNDNNNYHHDCECYHCKKIFMVLVLLILTFMAGIMVGNCGRCRYSDYYYNNQAKMLKHHHKKHTKMHRGMHQVPQNVNTPNGQVEGFIIEVDQSNWEVEYIKYIAQTRFSLDKTIYYNYI